MFTCGDPNLNFVPKLVASTRKANVLPLTLKSNFSVYVSIGLVEDLCDDPVEVCVMPEPENVCAFNVKSCHDFAYILSHTNILIIQITIQSHKENFFYIKGRLKNLLDFCRKRVIH